MKNQSEQFDKDTPTQSGLERAAKAVTFEEEGARVYTFPDDSKLREFSDGRTEVVQDEKA